MAEIRYARVGEVHVAYEVRGSGPQDLFLVSAGLVPLDVQDDEPRLARFLARLGRLGRLIQFNRRGIGLSDPVDPAHPPTLDDWVEDCIAVLEACDARDAVVIGCSGGAKVAVALAARRPDLVGRLVTVNGVVRPIWEDLGLDAESVLARRRDSQRPNRGPGEPNDWLTSNAPSVAGDPAFRAWWDSAGRRGASPGTADAIITVQTEIDVSDLLPALPQPVLVIQRQNLEWIPPSVGRWIAAQVPDARLVELPGADQLFWIDADAVVAEIEDTLTGRRSAPDHERRVLTVLFTDIVGSTEEAVRRGDGDWRAVLDHHDAGTRRVVERFGGRVVKSTGDGVLACFEEPGQAVRAGSTLVGELAGAGIELRVGIHAGEVELRGDDVAGLAVHLAARVEGEAAPGQVLVSRTVRDLLLGSTLSFTRTGDHMLKGLPEPWALYALEG